MAFLLIYKDPAKQTLQRVQIVLMLLLLPLGCFGAWRGYQLYATFEAADAEYKAGEQLMDGGKWADAYAHLRQAVTLYPEHYAAWDAMSTCYYMQGDYENSQRALQEGLTHLPQEGRLHRELGQAYHVSGKHDLEKASLEKAQTLLPGDPFVGHLLKRSTACLATDTQGQKSPK